MAASRGCRIGLVAALIAAACLSVCAAPIAYKYSGPYIQATCLEGQTPGFSAATLFTVEETKCLTVPKLAALFQGAAAARDRATAIVAARASSPNATDGNVHFKLACAGEMPKVASYEGEACSGAITATFDLGACGADPAGRFMRWSCSVANAAGAAARPSPLLALALAALAVFLHL